MNDITSAVVGQACKVQAGALCSGKELSPPAAGIHEAIARIGSNTSYLDQHPEGRSLLGWMGWPAMLRRLDRTEPDFRS
jgi:hypothetical protein